MLTSKGHKSYQNNELTMDSMQNLCDNYTKRITFSRRRYWEKPSQFVQRKIETVVNGLCHADQIVTLEFPDLMLLHVDKYCTFKNATI